MATLNRHILTHREVRDAGPYYAADPGVSSVQNVITNVIWFVFGVIAILLAFRFVFALLGADPANGFASFIYSTSQPFVAPFFGLFHYNVVQTGASRFEIYTLVALAVYALIAWALTALVNINRRY